MKYYFCNILFYFFQETTDLKKPKTPDNERTTQI